MDFSATDIVFLILYFVISLGLGLLLGKKGGSSLSEYFLSGRRAPWWLAGTGMVATTFAADTPLAVAGLVGQYGIAGNWVWWSGAVGGMLTVFFFARLWRRSGVLTDLEFIELRYGGVGASILRGFKAIYFGLVINALVIGWVNLAMMKILAVVFPGFSPEIAVSFLAFFTMIYVGVTGLWGVAVADMFQFIVAMTGSVVLAWFAMHHEAVIEAGGLLSALPPGTFRFFPDIGAGANSSADVYGISWIAFITFIGVQWWASWYPGAEPGGGGYIAQRIMSARSEKEGVFAVLWFVIAHYAVRPWPWILAGLAALVIYPDLPVGEKESGYVMLIKDVLPSPFRGLLVAAFAGAYMSTISTQINWGASYLINDFYLRFINRTGEERERIIAARISGLLILIFSLLVSFFILKTVGGAWMILLEFGAGTGVVLILRWYWWRVNALSEIVSMLIPAAGTIMLRFLLPAMYPESFSGDGALVYLTEFPVSLLINTIATLMGVLLTIYIAGPESAEVLQEFYRKTRPTGPGWKLFGYSPNIPWNLILGWVSGVILVYSFLFFGGKLIFDQTVEALFLSGLIVTSVIVLWIVVKTDFKGEE